MREGQFFENFFTDRGEAYEPNDDGEIGVCCPFLHDKGYETRPSAWINEKKNVFICFTCQAEGRESGFSEVSFASKVLNVPYLEAVELIGQVDGIAGHSLKQWERPVNMLQENKTLLDYLFSRGISAKVAKEYQLGYAGGGILYPIIVFDTLVDVREYTPGGTPKMRSQSNAKVSLFPFDKWRLDKRPTIICAGENDCLLLRSKGFNAITTTGGEGQFPKIFVSYFKNREVYICYDCDKAGSKGSRKVAHALRESGVKPKFINLGLPGTPDSKDVTDFFTKVGKTVEEFESLMMAATDYNEDMYLEDKNKIYPLVNLWHVANSNNENKRLSTRVLFSGKYDMDMRIPNVVNWECLQNAPPDAVPPQCIGCPLYKQHGTWSLGDKNLKDLLYIVEQNDVKVVKAIREQFIGFPKDCPAGRHNIVSRTKVHKAVFSPDVATEQDVDGYQAAEQQAYIIGDLNMQEGSRYRTYFRSCAHPLDGNRVYMVVDRVEESDNALNTFRMTPEINQRLAKTFRLRTVEESMRDRAKRMKEIINQPFMNPVPMITHTLDLAMHSPLSFIFANSPIDKGYGEFLIIGESGVGKSEAATSFINYVGIGNITVLKEASRASLLGGVDKLPNGSLKVKWGTIPRNHKGFLTLDELGGASKEVLAALTDMRSSGLARLEKMGTHGSTAPAKTRMFWLSNPRSDGNRERPIDSYAYGTDIVRELIGKDEDIRRFDAILIVTKKDTLNNDWMETEDCTPHSREDYRNLIYWVWSRKQDQIKWESGVEKFVKQTADALNEKYDTHIKIFGLEAWKKIARLSVACAGATYSATEDGECILVTKEHVEFVKNYLLKCYINPTFKLDKFVAMHRLYEETNEATNELVGRLIVRFKPIIRTLIESPDGYCSFKQLEYSAPDKKTEDVRMLISHLSQNYLVRMTQNNIYPTARLQKALDYYRAHHGDFEMSPVTDEGKAGI